jgi:hypothetical protein
MSHFTEYTYRISCWGGELINNLVRHFLYKNCLEHTKPFYKKTPYNELGNPYVYNTFMQTFNVLKFSTPISTRDEITFLPRNDKLTLSVPFVKLYVLQNFAFKASKILNDVKKLIFQPFSPFKIEHIIPGSTENCNY